MASEKVAASLNPSNEEEAYVLSLLPDSDRSQVIKDALYLYYKLFQNADSVSLDDLRELPDEPGVYAVQHEGDIVYVGRSKHIKTRWTQHHKYELFRALKGDVAVSYVIVPEDRINKLEHAIIHALDPEFNSTGGQDTNSGYYAVNLHHIRDRELIDKLESMLDQLGSKSAVLRHIITRYVEDLPHLETKRQEIARQHDQRVASLNAEIEKLDHRKLVLEQQLEDLRAQVRDKDKMIAQYQIDTDNLRYEMQKHYDEQLREIQSQRESRRQEQEDREMPDSAPAPIDTSALASAIADGVARGIQQAGGLTIAATNGSNGHKPADGEEREDPNDPLVKNLINASFDEL